MTHLDYRTNRAEPKARLVADLPIGLVAALDEWGVKSGMKSRREATETLLREALKGRANHEEA